MYKSLKPIISCGVSALVGAAILSGFATNAFASGVTVTDITDWSHTPEEVVTMNTPFLGYNGGVYAGINDLSVFDGTTTTVYDGFCIDPFHFSDTTTDPYAIVPLAGGSKLPATLNTYTANEIGALWAEFFSPTMSSPAAAGLQIAIWELVSSNAVATGQLPASKAVTFSSGTYTAAADLASLAGYSGPIADLVALTGPGQDYVIDIPGNNVHHNSVADSGESVSLLVLALGALFLARRDIMSGAKVRA
jgi:hypothetical protein